MLTVVLRPLHSVADEPEQFLELCDEHDLFIHCCTKSSVSVQTFTSGLVELLVHPVQTPYGANNDGG